MQGPDNLRMDFYGAHADRGELVRYLECQEPTSVRRTFLVHGVERGFAGLRERISAQGFTNIAVPKRGQRFEL